MPECVPEVFTSSLSSICPKFLPSKREKDLLKGFRLNDQKHICNLYSIYYFHLFLLFTFFRIHCTWFIYYLIAAAFYYPSGKAVHQLDLLPVSVKAAVLSKTRSSHKACCWIHLMWPGREAVSIYFSHMVFLLLLRLPSSHMDSLLITIWAAKRPKHQTKEQTSKKGTR